MTVQDLRHQVTGESLAEAVAAGIASTIRPDKHAYLLVDASRAPEIAPVLGALTDHALCLFEGQAREDLSEVAPWLVPLTADGEDDVFHWFMDEGWGKDWGIILFAGPEPARVKTGLKRALKAEDEEGRTLFFKYYRPSVFRTYLPAFEPEQAAYIMRDLSEVWTEDEARPDLIRRFAVRDGRLLTRDLNIVATETD
ncbi:DUF4123 domain-containing protein [Tropicibacter alexandrii]|uniref:DUF4123 domain-containing protein n=1 Tax=Tropicibacter alexandrii TaxID=2267683 RepID=UPI000EF51612|nr:DUF4123 domain-containing protein [Tropicibacter alexandrii]